MEVEGWLKRGVTLLRRIGLEEGQIMLDFGCGKGNYALPASIIVGEGGIIYALDKNGWALDVLMRRARSHGLSNIVRMETSGEVDINLEESHVDMVLLYDVFWYFPIYDERLPRLLDEINRICKPGGTLSVYPKHIDSEKLCVKITQHGFALREICTCTLLHNGGLETDRIYNFTTNH
ncbi:MAG: class I SAM-dependent methyltransferase [Candidatus Bathyarchaeia archaeon]